MKTITILLTISLILPSCKNKQNEEILAELGNISDAIKIQTREPSMDMQMSDILFPKRYHKMAVLYSDLRAETKTLNNALDSLIFLNETGLSRIGEKHFQNFFSLIEEIYIPRLDTVRGGDDFGNNYQYTQLTLLEKYLNPLKIKIKSAKSIYDLEIIKIYINLIEREVIDFIYSEALAGTVAITSIKPITIKNGRFLECYLASYDTCNNPYILIGKFKHYNDSDNHTYYKELNIVDTAYFINEKGIIDLNEINGYEAIARLKGPNGEPIQFKVY